MLFICLNFFLLFCFFFFFVAVVKYFLPSSERSRVKSHILHANHLTFCLGVVRFFLRFRELCFTNVYFFFGCLDLLLIVVF